MGERPFDRSLDQRAGKGMDQLGGDEAGRVEVELHREIDAGGLLEIVEQAAARPAPEDEALDEAGAEHPERIDEHRARHGRPLRGWTGATMPKNP